MAAVETALWKEQRLFVKLDSREMITASHVTFESFDIQDNRGSRWKVQPAVRILGHSVTCTGCCAEDVKVETQKIFACFWKNSRFLATGCIPHP